MMAVTPRGLDVEIDGHVSPAGQLELRDLARGFAGALFVSLPLLFTMEMWEVAKTMPDWVLVAFLGIGFLFNRLYIQVAGYRCAAWQNSKWWDAIVTMGIGAVTSILTLFVTGIIGPNLDWFLTAKTVMIETIPTSMGAAVAINQLGGGDSVSPEKMGFSPDVEMMVGTLLGGFLFAFNIAPTVEPKVIVLQQDWWHVGATMLLSLAASYLMVEVAQFEMRDLKKRRVVNSAWLEALISYIVAFLVSMLLLWVFGYGTPGDPIEVWLPQTIVLAYATTLGGAAGRLVL